ncbi:MAG: hypothetical protein MZV70_29790 [Desulfobacterales bacterium]|nr:hypothetical protein [Desulfobacterales bacterium]
MLLSAAAASRGFPDRGGQTVVDQAGRQDRRAEAVSAASSRFTARTPRTCLPWAAASGSSGFRRTRIIRRRHAQKPVFSYHDDPEKFLAAASRPGPDASR